jgi:hypothetical protein
MGTDPFRALRGEGRRGWRRFELDPSCGLRVRVRGATGWSLSARTPFDLSMGGVSLSIGILEERRVRVGEELLLAIALQGREFDTKARALHLSRTKGRVFDDRKLGIRFLPGASYAAVRAPLAAFLLRQPDRDS